MPRVHQLCARIEFGDAVSNHVLEIDRALRDWGYETCIFANTRDQFGCQVARPDTEYATYMRERADVLIYHYSVYCANHKLYLDSRNKRILVYHNITPPEFFEQYDKGVAEFCRLGRALLPGLTGCELALGDSEYNRLELVDAGFDPGATGVLPIFVDYEGLLAEPRDRGIEKQFGKPFNFLFVGRRVPNKRLEDVLRAFCYYNRCVNADSNLVLAGPPWVDAYDAQLRWLVDSFGLWEHVYMTGRVSPSELATYYRVADAYLTMSEHEGFAVPMVESMAFGLPVLAYSTTAVPYTLAGTGLAFTSKDYPLVAELAERLRLDAPMREKVVEGQRARLEEFSPASVRSKLQGYLEQVAVSEPG